MTFIDGTRIMKYRIITKGKNKGRVQALREILPYRIKKGTIGGFVKSYDNLSQEGGCWVGDDARILDNARVSRDAYVGNSVIIEGNAIVEGQSNIRGLARISENAYICDDVVIMAWVRVYGSARITGPTYLTGGVRIGGYAVIDNCYLPAGVFEGCEILLGNRE